jgi:hypothetical protein
MVFVLTLGRPVYENDAVQYFKVATLMYERSSVAFYPLIPAVADDGMWASSSHPLGYYGMLVWSFLMNGSAAPDAAKLVAPMHLVYCVIAIGVLMAKWGWSAFLAATLLLVSTPALFLQTVGLGIDPARLFLLAITAAWLHAALWADHWRVFAVAGMVAGLSLYSHSLNGIVTPLIVAAVIVCCYKAAWGRRWTMLCLTTVLAALIGGEQYVLNTLKFGVPIYDEHVIWKLVPSLDYLGWKSTVLHFNDVGSRLMGGPFLGFKDWYTWGLSFWAALFGVLFLWRSLASDDSTRIALVATVVVLAILIVYFGLASTSLGYALNYRYVLTIFPFVAIFGGAWVGRLVDAKTHSAVLR